MRGQKIIPNSLVQESPNLSTNTQKNGITYKEVKMAEKEIIYGTKLKDISTKVHTNKTLNYTPHYKGDRR